MRKKTKLLLCLLLVIGLTQLSAQNGKKTEKIEEEFTYWQPVQCPNQEPDVLNGKTIFSGVQLYNKDGIVIWQNCHNIGTATSENTGEIFEVKEVDKQYPNVTFVIWHFNLIGNQGSRYLGSMTWNWTTGDMTVDKFVCVENGKK
jgi:hypothetical protein